MEQNKPYYNDSRENYHHRDSPRRRDHRQGSGFRQHQSQRKNSHLPILLYLPAKYLAHLKERNYFVFDNIEKKTRVNQLEIDSQMSLNDSDFQTVRIYDRNTDRKIEAANILLDHYLNKHCLSHDHQDDSKKLQMLIPEQIVSLFIGKGGKNIKKLMDNCRTQITISQPINEATHRTLEIKGKSVDVKYACSQVLFQQEKIVSKYNLQDFQPTNLDLDNAIIKAKFALDRNFCNYVESDLWKQFQHLKLQVSIEENFDNIQEINDNESICIIEGELKNVQNFIHEMIEKMQTEKNDQDHEGDPLKILIQNNFVRVSQKDGSMIKEIASKSHGAQIKILSNKKQEMSLKDCVVTVNGNQLRNKQEAAKIILEKLEIFRKGISFGQPDFDKSQGHQDQHLSGNYNQLQKKSQNDFQRRRSYEMERSNSHGGDRYQNYDRNKPHFDNRRRDDNERDYNERDYNARGGYNKYNQDFNRGYSDRGRGGKFNKRDSFQRNRNDSEDNFRRQNVGERKFDRHHKYDKNDRYERHEERYNRNDHYEREKDDRYNRDYRRERDDRYEEFNRRGHIQDQSFQKDRYENRKQQEEKRSRNSENQSSQFSKSRSKSSGRGSVDSKSEKKVNQENNEFNIDFQTLKYENENMKDPKKNFSYLDKKDNEFKIVQKILVPGYLANYMAQDKIKKAINDKRKELNCKIKVESEQDNFQLENNVQGRQIRFEGTPDSCSKLFLFLTKLLMKIENALNGVNNRQDLQNQD